MPAEKLVLFERLKAAGAFVHESATELAEAEKTLRMFAAMEKGVGDEIGKTAEAAFTAELSGGEYDCIMVGAGLRIVPPYFLLFEKLINAIHRHASASTKICINTNPSDTADAVQRWV